MEPDLDRDRDELVAEALGIDLDTLERLGDFEIVEISSEDGLLYAYEVIFDEPIPAGIRRYLNEPRTDRSAVIGPNSFDYAGDNWEDDIPWADPQIQRNYEAALGRFLVRFNRIENAIDTLAAKALRRLGRSGVEVNGPFLQRVERLELIMFAFPTWPAIPRPEIKALAGNRNELAHGHFDQNPYSGDYEIVGRKRRRPWSPSEIDALGDEADKIWDKLRTIEAAFLFETPF